LARESSSCLQAVPLGRENESLRAKRDSRGDGSCDAAGARLAATAGRAFDHREELLELDLAEYVNKLVGVKKNGADRNACGRST
jgi:hypothetical protein